MKKNLFLFLLLSIIACKESSKKTYYELINNNFFQFVDTAAYKTGRLIQIPNDSSNELKFDNLYLEIDTNLAMPIELSSSIQNTLRNQKLPDFEKLFLNGPDLSFDKIELIDLKNTGKFKLFTSEQVNKNRYNKIIGKIKFYNPFISREKAIITLTISESSKAGYTKVYLFNRQNGNWKNINSFDIERW